MHNAEKPSEALPEDVRKIQDIIGRPLSGEEEKLLTKKREALSCLLGIIENVNAEPAFRNNPRLPDIQRIKVREGLNDLISEKRQRRREKAPKTSPFTPPRPRYSMFESVR